MLTWAVAWASVRHGEPEIMVLSIFAMVADVAIVLGLAALLWAQYTT